MKVISLLVLVVATLAAGQRPFFAGSKPIGYPEITTTEGLGDRFGEIDGTTQRLPIEANGDRDLVDRLSKLPIDKQPFWFINWQALEANRQKPQTYPQKPNPFIDPPLNSGSANINSANPNLSSDSASSSVANSNSNINTKNRFGTDNKDVQTSKPNIQNSGSSNISHTNSGNKIFSSNGNIANNNVYHGQHY